MESFEAHFYRFLYCIQMQPGLEDSPCQWHFLSYQLAPLENSHTSLAMPFDLILIIWIWWQDESCSADCLGCSKEYL